MTEKPRRRKHNVFNLLLGLTGMSLVEAAHFHSVSLDSATSWSSGRRQFPPGVIDELRALIAEQYANAAQHLALIARDRASSDDPDRFYQLNAPGNDADARIMGYPCVGAWRGMAGRVIASSPTHVRIGEDESVATSTI